MKDTQAKTSYQGNPTYYIAIAIQDQNVSLA